MNITECFTFRVNKTFNPKQPKNQLYFKKMIF